MSSVQQPSFHRQPRLAMLSPVRPWVANISSKNLKKDALAGLTNAAIVLPQGVAFAIIAGLPPEYGLYTAMVTAIIAVWWGSSAIMVSGPTTAISAILFASLSNVVAPGSAAYISLALTMTFLVGVLQLGAGFARFGGLISFISHSVIVGFTAAAALLIAASQFGGALGIETERGKRM
jgi:SulP family sulfate permease